MGAGVWVGVAAAVRLEEGVRVGLALAVAERERVGEGVAEKEVVAEVDCVARAVGLRLAVLERVTEGVTVLLRVELRVPLGVTEEERVGVAEREDPGEGVRDRVAVAEQVGAALRPGVVQPGQGQSTGAAEPAGQKLPTGHCCAWALALPRGQYHPALQLPLQAAVPRPVVLPYTPPGHRV
jgi:hypothetical protein